MTAAEAMRSLESLRERVVGLYQVELDARASSTRRALRLEEELGAIDRALDALKRDTK